MGPFASSIRAYFRYSRNMHLYWTALEHGRSRGIWQFEFANSMAGSGQGMMSQVCRQIPLSITLCRDSLIRKQILFL